MKLVEFWDGTYGIQKWTIFGYKYYDFKARRIYWWSKSSNFFEDCKTDLETAKQKFIQFTSPVKRIL